ncbi:MAG: hypothetical protein Q7S99_09880 [Parvibaculum sp.]|nr:hypothetical protein [Parvibaculum sp.]|tara:strand:- start:693 stop:1049 length:357 start_codon:yes stop_codon:yes gene_type:complete
MRLFYSVLVASVAFAGVAFAAGNENLFGNTVVITSATGVTKAMVNGDNTYETHLADGSVVKGTWAADGANTCYTQTEPAPAAEAKPFCTPNEARAVGDKWSAKGPDGSDVSFELVAGH